MDYRLAAVLMVQTWRKRRGLTMEQLADMLGVSPNSLAAKFQRKTVDAALFLKIIHVLDVKTFDKEFQVIVEDMAAKG